MRTVLRCVVLLCTVAAAVAAAQRPVRAADTFTRNAYVEYSGVYGDTYNGVTSDDAEPSSGSFAAKIRIDLGRYSAAYRAWRDATLSQANTTTPSGGPGTLLTFPAGQIVVPQFSAVDSQSEYRLEYQPWRVPVYLGVAYANTSNNYGFPRLSAFGYGIELQQDASRFLSPYGSYFYFPSQTGTYALSNPNNPNSGSAPSAFIANELELGASLTFRKTGLSLVAGYYQNTNVRKTGTYNFVRDGPFVGVGFRFKY